MSLNLTLWRHVDNILLDVYDTVPATYMEFTDATRDYGFQTPQQIVDRILKHRERMKAEN